MFAALVAGAPAAQAATLLEAEIDGQPAWVIDDPTRARVLISDENSRRLVDLRTGIVYLIARNGSAQKIRTKVLPPVTAEVPLQMVRLGPGPRVARYPTTRYRLVAGQTRCAVIDTNHGLGTHLSFTTAALALLERIEQARSRRIADDCSALPYGMIARRGWAMRITEHGTPAIATVAVIPDYVPIADELSLPMGAVDITQDLVEAAARR
ncbi:MAG: hypothetical protein QGF53_03760 [Alphaproteobacteria bacterium]|jgi:hypothetical protein|nr:hypothetical protein [Alphaproteobacteria bacterium]